MLTISIIVAFLGTSAFASPLTPLWPRDCITPPGDGYGCSEADYYPDCSVCVLNCTGGRCNYNGKGTQVTCSACPASNGTITP
ncbi:uncharacterized protein F4822DRAFT_401545 [Hypoxylon trugodes]|uniref:uncharacterized protein n=1 Tax=Hypoxylon trugodes TaxID=326681 RepID=UPI002199BEF7|nr:uncharacterized protein F4822DRAFT_401545 [Hypoxylon trugodes]KAI1390321.1 hypothetical protein F4822DRAFT_401545 [Hypoxylon trugodes]